MIIILPFIALIIFIVLKSKFIKNKYLTTFLKYIFIASLISVSLELTIFNFRHYESLFYQNPQDYTNFTYGDGLKCHNNICTIINPETAYIELSNLDTKINDLKLTFDSPNALIVSYDLYFTDAANGEYLQAGTRTYVKNNTRSHYLPLNTSGNTTKLKLTFKDSNYPFNLTKITLNTKIPLIINNLRLLLVFLISFIIFVINPRSILHHF